MVDDFVVFLHLNNYRWYAVSKGPKDRRLEKVAGVEGAGERSPSQMYRRRQVEERVNVGNECRRCRGCSSMRGI